MDINELTASRDGVFSAREARECGVSASAIKRRVRSGAWTVVARGVYIVAGHLRSARAQARIAVLSVHSTAVLGGAAAAWWLGFHDKEPRKHLVFTPKRGPHQRSSATAVVRYRVLHDEDVKAHDGLRATSAALTVLDASVELGIAVIDRALLSRRVTVEQLEAAHRRYPKRHGATVVAGYLRLLGDGARSEAERLTVKLFNDAGITGWVVNLPVCGYIVDFAFAGIRLGVEIDGLAFHSDDESFQRDRTKRNVLTDSEWRILNDTYRDIVDRPAYVVGQVSSVIKGLSTRDEFEVEPGCRTQLRTDQQ